MTTGSQFQFLRRMTVALLFAGAVLLGSSCRQERVVKTPKERTALLLEILDRMDMEDYDAAIPKIRRYKTIDDTNEFLHILEETAVTNKCLADTRYFMDKGDYAAAADYMQKAVVKYEALTDDCVFAEQFTKSFVEAEKQIGVLGTDASPETIRKAVEKLKQTAQHLPKSEKIVAYAERRGRDADALEKLLPDRRYLWLYFDALDARTEKDGRTADLLTAVIAADSRNGSRNPMVKELMNDGMFD